MKALEQVRHLETLSQATTQLKELGFNKDYVAQDGAIVDSETGQSLAPEKYTVIETYRFEGMSNPADNVLLLALESDDGGKGTLVSSYATTHSQDADLIKKIRKKEDA